MTAILADIALFAYLAMAVAVGCMALDLGVIRAVMIAILWPIPAAVELGAWVASKWESRT